MICKLPDGIMWLIILFIGIWQSIFLNRPVVCQCIAMCWSCVLITSICMAEDLVVSFPWTSYAFNSLSVYNVWRINLVSGSSCDKRSSLSSLYRNIKSYFSVSVSTRPLEHAWWIFQIQVHLQLVRVCSIVSTGNQWVLSFFVAKPMNFTLGVHGTGCTSRQNAISALEKKRQ